MTMVPMKTLRRSPWLMIKLGFVLAVLPAFLHTMTSDAPAATPHARSELANLLRGQSTIMVTSAATVKSKAHYQAMVVLTCGNATCYGDFPAPGTKRRIQVTRISCYVKAGNGSTYTAGYAKLLNAQDQVLILEFLPVDFTSAIGDHQLNRAVDFQIANAQYLEVTLQADSSYLGYCTATGTLETLQ